jgi:hypothetical protein
MAALSRIQKSRDRAENDHETGAQKRHHRNHHDGDNGQYQGVFDQGLPLPAGPVPGKRQKKWFDDGYHLWKLTKIINKIHQRNSFDNKRDIERSNQADESIGKGLERMELLKPLSQLEELVAASSILELAGNGREHALNLAAEGDQDGDGDHRNESQNQGVLNESLALLALHTAQRNFGASNYFVNHCFFTSSQ